VNLRIKEGNIFVTRGSYNTEGQISLRQIGSLGSTAYEGKKIYEAGKTISEINNNDAAVRNFQLRTFGEFKTKADLLKQMDDNGLVSLANIKGEQVGLGKEVGVSMDDYLSGLKITCRHNPR